MAVVVSQFPQSTNLTFQKLKHSHNPKPIISIKQSTCYRNSIKNQNSEPDNSQDGEADSAGVKVALSMLKFYKREISPILPKSCRFVPSCSEYSMIAYKKYGVVKGTVLTAWRLCRCNPVGLGLILHDGLMRGVQLKNKIISIRQETKNQMKDISKMQVVEYNR